MLIVIDDCDKILRLTNCLRKYNDKYCIIYSFEMLFLDSQEEQLQFRQLMKTICITSNCIAVFTATNLLKTCGDIKRLVLR